MPKLEDKFRMFRATLMLKQLQQLGRDEGEQALSYIYRYAESVINFMDNLDNLPMGHTQVSR